MGAEVRPRRRPAVPPRAGARVSAAFEQEPDERGVAPTGRRTQRGQSLVTRHGLDVCTSVYTQARSIAPRLRTYFANQTRRIKPSSTW